MRSPVWYGFRLRRSIAHLVACGLVQTVRFWRPAARRRAYSKLVGLAFQICSHAPIGDCRVGTQTWAFRIGLAGALVAGLRCRAFMCRLGHAVACWQPCRIDVVIVAAYMGANVHFAFLHAEARAQTLIASRRCREKAQTTAGREPYAAFRLPGDKTLNSG